MSPGRQALNCIVIALSVIDGTLYRKDKKGQAVFKIKTTPK
jgi:hypothetical protein